MFENDHNRHYDRNRDNDLVEGVWYNRHNDYNGHNKHNPHNRRNKYNRHIDIIQYNVLGSRLQYTIS
jgi:hypothetical protein